MILGFLSLCPLAWSQIVYVDASNTNLYQDGTSWEEAYSDLTQALNNAKNGNAIWLARGVYYPTSGSDRELSFQVSGGIEIIGGFRGDEASKSERDFVSNKSILSGDIGIENDNKDNSFTVVRIEANSESTILDGVIVRDGNADLDNDLEPFYSPKVSGGGVHFVASEGSAPPVIRNCSFIGNYAKNYGGAVLADLLALKNTTCVVDSCNFLDNEVGQLGAAAWIRSGKSSISILNSTFFGNAGIIGAALALTIADSSSVRVDNCKFGLNTGFTRGTSLLIHKLTPSAQIEILNCRFKGDTAINSDRTSMLYLYDFNFIIDTTASFDIYIDSCEFLESTIAVDSMYFYPGNGLSTLSASHVNLYVDRCVFYNSSLAVHKESGLFAMTNCTLSKFNANYPAILISLNGKFLFANTHIYECEVQASSLIEVHGQVEFLNCNIFSNKCDFELFSGPADYKLSNTVISDNKTGLFTNGLRYAFAYVNTLVVNSCFFDISNDYIVSNTNPGAIVTFKNVNQFSSSPMFRADYQYDFTPLSCSPLVNAGDNVAVLSKNLSGDIFGNARINNIVVDIGPIEHTTPFSLYIDTIVHLRCYGDNDGMAVVEANGVAPLNLTWSGQANTAGTQFDSLQSGEYIGRLEDGDGCLDSLSFQIAEPPILEISLDVINVECYAEASGRVELNVAGGTPTYRVLWNDGNMGLQRYNLPAGSYTAVVIDSNGCTDDITVDIVQPTQIQCDVNLQHPSSNFSADGSIELLGIMGGNPTYSYEWEDGTMDANRDSLASGKYLLTVIDASNCQVIKEFRLSTLTDIKEFEIRTWPTLFDTQSQYRIEIISPRNATVEWFVVDSSGRQVSEKYKEGITPGVIRFLNDLQFASGYYATVFFVDGKFYETHPFVVANL